MIPTPNITIEKPARPQSVFMNAPTFENLVEDIKLVGYDLNLYINTLQDQRDRVLALNNAIKNTLNTFSYMSDFKVAQILNGLKYFILISNRTMEEFNIEISLMLYNERIQFTLR